MPGDQPYVAVVGGGPAGLIAAERLAAAGTRVTVFEHKRSVGRKFLLAGRGGLNITHGEPIDDMLARFGEARPFLEAAIRAFSPDDLRSWSADLGEPTFLGTSDRVFPESFRATPLLRAWLQRLNGAGVEVLPGHRWSGWTNTGANEFETPDGSLRIDQADATIFALGGASWPRVGSDGGWTTPFRTAGIAVHDLEPANCGVLADWSSALSEKFAGQPIKNAVFSCGTATARGDGIITESGLEGGPIYALGPAIRRELAAYRTAELRLDLHPDLDLSVLVGRLSKRRAKASVTSWLNSAGISPVSVSLVREATSNTLPNDPSDMAGLLKAAPLTINAMAPIERAISTAGGIALSEIDAGYMIIRQPGVFVAGEMLDWEAPTGGYLLQACFSTGVAAANGALAWLGGV
jgi:uncharacterized flavoprotein (TIGR03862 family)